MSIFTPRPFGKYWMIMLYARPGNCKSIEQARFSWRLFQEYHYTERWYPELPHRILLTNQKLNDKISNSEILDGHLLYWTSAESLQFCPREICWKAEGEHLIHDVDIAIDECNTLFPADGYKDLPEWLRNLFAQHRHRGIRILLLTQDYRAVDINIRRMLWAAYNVKKWIGSRDIAATYRLYTAGLFSISFTGEKQ